MKQDGDNSSDGGDKGIKVTEKVVESKADARRTNFAKQMTTKMPSLTTTLNVTGDVVLDGSEFLGSFVVDKTGALGIEHTALHNVILRLVKAINAQSEHLDTMQMESDGLHGTVHAMQQQVLGFETRISENEDLSREMKVELDTLCTGDRQDNGNGSEEVKHEEFVVLVEKVTGFAERIDALEQAEKENGNKWGTALKSFEETVKRHQDTLDDDIDPHLSHLDDMILALKMDLETLQVSLKDLNLKKANKVDFVEMQKNVEEVLEKQRLEQATLADAHKNLEKLDDCVTMAAQNKDRVQELWRLFREESQESREWSARNFNDLRNNLMTKMDAKEVLCYFDELRHQVRNNTSVISEATSRVEAGIRHKAEIGDVVRLKDTLDDMKTQSNAPRPLLVGTKCLACGKQMTTADTQDQGCVDALKERQQEYLFKDVQRVLSKVQSGTADQEALKYVAVHIGSPIRIKGYRGEETYEGRDTNDHSSRSYNLIREPGSVPNARGVMAPLTSGGGRMQPREVQPIVRVVKRRPGMDVRNVATPRGPAPNPHLPPTPKPIRAALGATKPRTEQCQVDVCDNASNDMDVPIDHNPHQPRHSTEMSSPAEMWAEQCAPLPS